MPQKTPEFVRGSGGSVISRNGEIAVQLPVAVANLLTLGLLKEIP